MKRSAINIGFFLNLVALILLVSGSTLSAHSKTSSLLWKISGNNLKKPSYLYGTVHSYDKRAFTFKSLVIPYIKQCKAFGMEIKLDELDPFSLLGKLQMRGDTTLRMLISPDDYAKLERMMRDSFSVELSMFSSVKPMFLMGVMQTTGTESDYSDFLDEFLMKRAKESHKELIGIETIAEQLGAIDIIPLQEQAKMLLDETLYPDTTAEPLEDLLDVYKNGDLDSLYSFYKHGELSNTFNKALILDRNHRMADRIDSIAQRKTIFVAVGALHLPGIEGVINLLRAKGYDVTPIWKKK